MEYTIAIDLGGTIIKAGLFEGNRLIDHKQVQASLQSGFQANLSLIEKTIHDLLSRHGVRPDQLRGIGLAFPGLVDPYKCRVISTNEKYDDAYGFDIKQWVKDRWDAFFCMDNDARLAVVGEWYCGAGAGRNNVVMMTIGTGIGTGVIMEGNVLYGPHFQAGSLGGHFVVDYRGRKCSCGNIGCVEALASSFFLPAIIRQHPNLPASFREKAEKMSFKKLFQWAEDGDQEAVSLRNECMDIWSAAIITYIHAYDPEVVILGGGVMNSRAVIIPYIQEKVNTYAWCPTEKVKVVCSELSDNAALWGLHYRMMQQQRSQDNVRIRFDRGIDITPHPSGTGFIYGADVFGPAPENRYLDDIRKSLHDPACAGPDVVYSIAMDVGKKKDRDVLQSLHLLFGVVTYAAGKLGCEPVRSQGHIHKVSSYSGWSTPEVYEIWSGKAIIFMQEKGGDDPGICYAVSAGPGEVVIVPPYWVHATISADPNVPLTFGAWCDRAYGFEYDEVRRHNGIAWFPVYNEQDEIVWKPNPLYQPSRLICKLPGDYSAFGIKKGKSVYRLFEDDPETFSYVSQPMLKQALWQNFQP